MSEQARTKLREWRENPVAFVRECIGVEPDPWQLDVLHNFPKQQRIAMKAAKGCGKTAILSWLSWNFLATRPFPKMAATSITKDNLTDNLWPEMALWQGRAKNPILREVFQWTKTRIVAKQSPENWFMSARTWPKSADSSQQADTLAGLHADYLMFVVDEVGGIPDAVMAAAEAGLATGIETKIVMAGNPTHNEGPLYRAASSERDLWFLIEITGDPDNPKRSPRISKQWALDQIKKYGRDNPWVLVNVFGQFPPSSINTLMGPDEVNQAMNRFIEPDNYEYAQKRLGIDVARFGDDRTVIFPRQGLIAFKPVELRNMRTNDIAARVIAAKAKWNSEVEYVDGTGGYGAGVVDSMIQAGHAPIEVNFAGKALDSRYHNKRAEMWFNMAEWVRKGSLPDLAELAKELSAPTYTIHNGKFLIEPKEQIKERLGFSPDIADALCLTFAHPEMPKMDVIKQRYGRDSNQAKAEYDPFDDSRHST